MLIQRSVDREYGGLSVNGLFTDHIELFPSVTISRRKDDWRSNICFDHSLAGLSELSGPG